MVDITQSQPHDWKYVSEGGATIVFSYRGPPHPNFDGKVLRLRKSVIPSVAYPESNSVNRPSPVVNEEPDDPTIEYQAKCMERLIPQAHLPRLQTVHLHRLWLEKLVELQNASRPERRREKDEIDMSRKKGVLATDLVGGNWLAVEIKPKWAFLPSTTHLSEETKSVKTQTCRFCMHTHLRVQKGQKAFTNYCPLDLFSGDKTRILKAINSLWDAWIASEATVNNLKIFSRGMFLLPSEAHLMLKDGVVEQTLEAIRDAFSGSLVRSLLDTPVLHIISQLQRQLDILDIEGLSRLWKLTESSAPLYLTTFASSLEDRELNELPPSTPIGMSSPFLQAPEPNISDWIKFLDEFESPERSPRNHASLLPENLHYYLMSYLLSATFKDCSIIVRLDFLDSRNQPSGQVPLDSVTVIDLEPKGMSKLQNWEKLDEEIVHTYASVEKKKKCIDSWHSPATTEV